MSVVVKARASSGVRSSRELTADRVEAGKKIDADDDRAPICPACGVTMGMTIDEDGSTRNVCLECGFSDGLSMGSELRRSSLPNLAQARG